MGQACAGLLQRVMNMEVFQNRQAGPTLRRFFGLYRQPDFWAVYRRFRAIDDGNGYVSYDELLKVVSLEEYQLLFLWEAFSQQDHLIHARELMTIICIFSSAPLLEKGKFLQTLFDDSKTGLNTASEVVSMFHMVLQVLTKCTGVLVKVKDVRDELKSALPELLPEVWAEALERNHNKAEATFNNDRFFGQIELEQILPTIQESYNSLPISGPPPDGACAPPPPDWAIPSSLENAAPKQQDTKPKATGPSASALSKGELAHLDWMSKLDEEFQEGNENNKLSNSSPDITRKAIISSSEEPELPPSRNWLVIHGADFPKVAKNLPAFRHLFMRSVSAALGIPMGCVEVMNVTRGSVVVEFLLRPSGRASDPRDGETLKQAFAQQLTLAHSALRKGPFKDYVASAELVDRSQQKSRSLVDTTVNTITPSPIGGSKPPAVVSSSQDDSLVQQVKELSEQNQQVMQDLEEAEAEARRWKAAAEEAIADRDAVMKEARAPQDNSSPSQKQDGLAKKLVEVEKTLAKRESQLQAVTAAREADAIQIADLEARLEARLGEHSKASDLERRG